MAELEDKAIVQTLVEKLRGEDGVTTLETKLLQPKLIRELYKVLGEPSKEDFPEEYETARCCGWDKEKGYTTYIGIYPAETLDMQNHRSTTYLINKPSATKEAIIERYENAGWVCEVQSHNVICTRYVKHPRYENIWVRFYSSRDCCKYQYYIEMEK